MLIRAGRIVDFDLDLLRKVIDVLDRELAAVAAASTEVPDADAWGYFDRMEHVVGMGFVACQVYMTATYGFLRVPKSKALDAGPHHGSQQTVASIINHAANYWKHQAEWVFDSNTIRQKRIREAFGEVGFPVEADYPLSGILTELTTPEDPTPGRLVPRLVEWRDALTKARGR